MPHNSWVSLGTTEEQLNKLLTRAKINLVGKKSGVFLASIMSQTRFYWSWDKPTAWTNGEWIKINPEFFFKLPKPSQITLIAHELMHIAYGHMLRIGSKREAMKWNIAADHVINLALKENGYSFLGLERGHFDPQYSGMATERVYDLLLPDAGQQGQGQSGVPLSDDIEEPTDKLNKQKIMTKVMKAYTATNMAKQAGDIPGEVVFVIEKFLHPIIPWEIVLLDFFMEANRTDYSYRRPNRRYEDMVLPSLMSEDGLIAMNFYQDASASVEDPDVLRMFSEVAHIKERYDPEILRLCAFDTAIRDERIFREGEQFQKMEITGRGGTDLAPVREHILQTAPKAVVIFSDFECEPMEKVPMPVLWVRVGDYGHVPSWGRVIQIDNEDIFD